MSNLLEFNEAVIAKAREWNLEVIRMRTPNTYGISNGRKTVTIKGAASTLDSIAGMDICCNKASSYDFMTNLGIPNPGYIKIYNHSELQVKVKPDMWPVVLKPIDTECGRGVTVNINSYAELSEAYFKATTFSRYILVQPHVNGSDYRFTVLGGRVAFVIRRDGEPGKPLNLALGNARTDVTDKLTPNNLISKACICLANTLRMHALGVDVIADSVNARQFQILELNSMPVLYPERAAMYLRSLFSEH